MFVWSHLVLTALWGGLLSLERRAFLQAMFSRPLVASISTGVLLDDVPSGVFVGLFFELFYLGSASLGGSHPDHELLPAVMASASSSALANASDGAGTPALFAVGILLFAPMGKVGRWVEQRLDARAIRYQGRALLSADTGELKRVARQNLRAMWPHFVCFGLLSGAATAVGYLLAPVVSALPVPALRALAWAYPAMAAVAAAVAVKGSRARFAGRIAAAAAALVTTAAAINAAMGGVAP